MSKLFAAASIAAVSAYVAPVAPKRATALAGSTLDSEINKINGAAPVRHFGGHHHY